MSSSGGSGGGFLMQATTGASGFTLLNSNQTIISWTSPNDGNLHRAIIFATLVVSTTQTGGGVAITLAGPTIASLFPGGQGTGNHINESTITDTILLPNTEYGLFQNSPQSAGAAVIYAEIWGS